MNYFQWLMDKILIECPSVTQSQALSTQANDDAWDTSGDSPWRSTDLMHFLSNHVHTASKTHQQDRKDGLRWEGSLTRLPFSAQTLKGYPHCTPEHWRKESSTLHSFGTVKFREGSVPMPVPKPLGTLQWVTSPDSKEKQFFKKVLTFVRLIMNTTSREFLLYLFIVCVSGSTYVGVRGQLGTWFSPSILQALVTELRVNGVYL